MNFSPEQVAQIRENYLSLTEQEKETLRRLSKAPEAQVVIKVLGPEFLQLLNAMAQPKRGLAAPR